MKLPAHTFVSHPIIVCICVILVQLDYVTALESFIHTCEEILVVVSELNDSINERLEPWSNLLNLCGSIEELLGECARSSISWHRE